MFGAGSHRFGTLYSLKPFVALRTLLRVTATAGISIGGRREAALLRERSADFASFYAVEFAPVMAATMAFTSDRDLAREATQEAFARALVHWDRIGDESWRRGWVIKTAINHCRKLSRRRARERSTDVEGSVAAPTGQRADIVAALKRIPERRRTALVLFYLADQSVAEIAHVMGITEGGVRAHLTIGRQALRTQMEEHDA